MKKMVLVAAFVFAAALVHGASCQWSIGNISASEKTEVATDSMIAYFMDGATYDTFSGLSTDKIASYVTGNAASSAKIIKGRSGATAGTSFGDYKPDDMVSGYIVIFDSSDASSASFYANTVSETKKVPGAGNVQFSKSFASETAGWKALSTTPGPGPVPEPTSGLLLVLGGAALALRRRR